MNILKRWLALLLMVMLWLPVTSVAQRKISGTIQDKRTQEPLPGAVIALQGSTIGSIAGADGTFTISLLDTNIDPVFRVTCVGYRPLLLPLGAAYTLDVLLEQDQTQLDEVVVTGQGLSVSKRRLSTNVVSIGEKDIENQPSTRLDQLLQTQLPNAQIRLTGGQSGATSIIRSRGVNSAFLSSTPIIYVDGVRLDNLNTSTNLSLNLSGSRSQGTATSAIADIPVENIEKIEFINGGAATTLYGSDAANGVIQIITKKGGSEKTDVTFETRLGAQTPTNDFLYFKRTPELLLQNGFFQQYNLAINGGQGPFGYSFSGNYLNSQGTLIFNQNQNQRFDFRTGFRAGLGKKVTYESSFSFVRSNFRRVRNGNAGGYTGLWFTESGASLITGPGFNNRLDELNDTDFERIKAYAQRAEELQNNQTTINRFQTSQVFKYLPLSNLTVKGTAGLDYRVQRELGITTNEYLHHIGGNTTGQGSIANYDRKYLGLTLELNGQHEARWNQFSVLTTLGGQLFRNDDHQIEYRGDNIRDGAQTISLAATRSSNEYLAQVVNYGVYVQENIGYQDKLFIDVGLRGDGNSAFGKNIGVQYYPKVGFSYIPSVEKYFQPVQRVVSSAKIRANIGEAGNFPTPFANERTVQLVGFQNDQAAFFGQAGNADLRPEKTRTIEAGVELGFFKNRILLNTGFYHSLTRDALFVVPPAPSTGENNQLRNIGRILNRGFEINTTLIPVQTKELEVRVRFALNTLHNEVLSSGGAAPFNLNGFSARTIQTVVQEGYPIGFLRGNVGVFGPEGTLQSTTVQSYLGTTLPTLFGNLGLNVQYKSWAFFANADYQRGAYANSFDRQFRFNYGVDNEGVPQAEIDKNKRTNWLNFTNIFTEKTDFLKVRVIGVNYKVRPKLRDRRIRTLSVGFTAENPFNFATSSFDPEATISGAAQGQGGATTGGISYATYSVSRQFVGTLRIQF